MPAPDALVVDTARSLVHKALVRGGRVYVLCDADCSERAITDQEAGEELLRHHAASLCPACCADGALGARNAAAIQRKVSRSLVAKASRARQRSARLRVRTGEARRAAAEVLNGASLMCH